MKLHESNLALIFSKILKWRKFCMIIYTFNYYLEYEMIGQILSFSLQCPVRFCPRSCEKWVDQVDQNTLEDENYGYSIGCQSIFFSGFLHGLFDFVEHQRRSGRKGYSSESVKAWTKKKKKEKTRIKRERQTFRNKTEEIYANIFLSKS